MCPVTRRLMSSTQPISMIHVPRAPVRDRWFPYRATICRMNESLAAFYFRKRWIRAPARPSAPRSKSVVFARGSATCGGGAHPCAYRRAIWAPWRRSPHWRGGRPARCPARQRDPAPSAIRSRWPAATSSSRCQRSWFFTGLRSAVSHPRLFHARTHSVMPRRTYSESVYSARAHRTASTPRARG